MHGVQVEEEVVADVTSYCESDDVEIFQSKDSSIDAEASCEPHVSSDPAPESKPKATATLKSETKIESEIEIGAEIREEKIDPESQAR